ncbi:MAG: hypothetical protein AMXMBFR58_18530 [Phycisphaerae bacterium]|nr:hypothetical protein [Phycisphaerales bacterium]MCK6475769.1 sigma-70 family RNA polymerase sigma factor [Phycisphaerales bacterium]
MTDRPRDMPSLLADHRTAVEAIVRREAGVVLLRFESFDDLMQGVAQEAIRAAPGFQWNGPEAFHAWIALLARRFLSGRREYWLAHKRNPGRIFRLTITGEGGQPLDRPELADTRTGPATFAFRREQLVLVTKSMAMLLPRDREIVVWLSEGATAQEIAARLGLSLDAAEKARTRALDRLRKTFTLLNKGR